MDIDNFLDLFQVDVDDFLYNRHDDILLQLSILLNINSIQLNLIYEIFSE
jgi:hypothetical protein